MQISAPQNLPKRSRYYQGMMDLDILEKGDDYNNMKKSLSSLSLQKIFLEKEGTSTPLKIFVFRIRKYD